MAHLKEQLVKELLASGLVIPESSPEWRKRPDKIKNAFLFEQAAIAIAKRKLAIRERLQEKYPPTQPQDICDPRPSAAEARPEGGPLQQARRSKD